MKFAHIDFAVGLRRGRKLEVRMVQGIMQEQANGMGADMRPLSVSKNHDVAYTDRSSTSFSGGLIAKGVFYPPISVVKCSLSVLDRKSVV